MTTKPGRVVTYSEELPSIKSHDTLITWFSDFGLERKRQSRHRLVFFSRRGDFRSPKSLLKD